ncbi:hypothetical protein WKK05_31095 [Nostoc sp. UHCC 0302]
MSKNNLIFNMSTVVLAALLVSLLTASGYAAIAYLFPQNNSQD